MRPLPQAYPSLLALILTGLVAAVVWLDSLDRYFMARYHLSLSFYLPESVFALSRTLTPWVERPASAEPTRSQLPTLAPSSPALAFLPPPYHPAENSGVSELAPGAFYPSLSNQTFDLNAAQNVLLVGDSMMQGLAPLVTAALKKTHPLWQFRDLSKQSTGLLVKRFFDWQAVIEARLQAEKTTLLIVFLGPNDPWDVYEKGTDAHPSQHIPFPSSEWELRYAQAVDDILRTAREHAVRVIWMGLPTMRSPRLHTGAIAQNRVFHHRAQAWQTDYVATEGVMGALTEPYSRYKTTPEGKTLNLRADDGTHFSAAGLYALRDLLVTHIHQSLP